MKTQNFFSRWARATVALALFEYKWIANPLRGLPEPIYPLSSMRMTPASKIIAGVTLAIFAVMMFESASNTLFGHNIPFFIAATISFFTAMTGIGLSFALALPRKIEAEQ